MNHSWVEIDLQRLKANARAIREAASQTEVMFVVKADAYGHGMVPIARAAAEEGVQWFAVAHLQSALTLREALSDVNILVIGPVGSNHVQELVENRITSVVVDLEHGLALARKACDLNAELSVHLKVDTGMGRLGFPWDVSRETIDQLLAAKGLRVDGVCSHFAKVEPADPTEACEQAARFESVLKQLPPSVLKHLSSSRAALYFPEWDFDVIRQGIDLYGYGAKDPAGRFQTLPILQWKARVVQVKDVPAGFKIGYYGTHVTKKPTRIATVSVGYADGYNRALSNRGDVLIGGRRCPVVGRVSMNWITADIGSDSAVQAGDEVVLIGEQGGKSIWAGELSKICRTIPYEILTSIHSSLERRYFD